MSHPHVLSARGYTSEFKPSARTRSEKSCDRSATLENLTSSAGSSDAGGPARAVSVPKSPQMPSFEKNDVDVAGTRRGNS